LKKMQTLIGQKKEQSQRFLESGKRIPVTLIDVKGNIIVSVKTQEKNNYQAVQLGFSMKKKATKAELGHVKGAKLEKAPKFLREVRISDEAEELPVVGTILDPIEVFEPGDLVDVSGFSKGKGFQGGVKRYGFHGGPKTHGQSDRHRAPGSIGAGTTPGRVYKGKRMAGNMGNDNVTIKNLEVIDVTTDGVLILKGLVPGIIDGPIMVKKVGKDKNFVPLYKSPEEKAAGEAAAKSEDAVQNVDVNTDEVKIEAEAVKEEVSDEVIEEKADVKTEEAQEEVSVGDSSEEEKVETKEEVNQSSEDNKAESEKNTDEIKEEGEKDARK
jgi:large subunit ribosomal protein L3